jgi:phage regulator Rha-like protein
MRKKEEKRALISIDNMPKLLPSEAAKIIELTKAVPYVMWKGCPWFIAQDIAVFKGKTKVDYSVNYAKPKLSHQVLRGRQEVLLGETLQLWRVLFEKEYDASVKTWRKLLIIDYERTYHYIHRSSDPPVVDKLEVPTGVSNKTLLVDSRLIASKLGIQHESLVRSIQRYKTDLEDFSPLIESEKIDLPSNTFYSQQHKWYMLTEEHAYFIGAISRNTEDVISYKKWLIKEFTKARRENILLRTGLSGEKALQLDLIALSAYTPMKLQAEYPLHDGNTHRRVDVLLGDDVAIELKNHEVTLKDVTEVVGERGYYELLSKSNPNFKHLILCSPFGIAENAQKMVELMHPKVIFLNASDLFNMLAEAALKHYPKESHWWLKTTVFPRFQPYLDKLHLSSDDYK